MIKYIFIFSLLLSFAFPSLASHPSIKQEHTIKDKRTMALSISPAHLFMASIKGKYLLKMNERVALTLPFCLSYLPHGISTLDQMLMLRSGAGLRYYFAQEALSNGGFFLDAELAAGYSMITPKMSASYTSFFMQPSTQVGYSWVLDSGLAINLALGTFYNHAFGDEALVIKKTLSGIDRCAFAANGFISDFGPTGELSLSYHW